MLFTPISKLHSSQYLLPTFKSNVGCLSTGPPDMDDVYIGLALLTGTSASLITIIADLMASIAACIIACTMPCPVVISCLYFLETALC